MEYICTITVLGGAWYYWNRKNKSNVPWVSGCLPIVGHGLSYQKDPLKFMKDAFKNHGPVFRMKLFRKTLTIVCDQTLAKEYFDAREDELSFLESLDDLYFDRAFSNEDGSMPFLIECVKMSVFSSTKYSEFTPIIQDDADRFIQNLKQQMTDGILKIDLTCQVTRLITRSTLMCFLKIDTSDELYDDIMIYSDYVVKVMTLTYIMPKWLVKLLYDRQLAVYRKKLTDYFEVIIQSYRDDPEKNDSAIIRKALAYTGGWKHDTKNIPLTNEQIANMIICLIFVSVSNTAYGLIGLLQHDADDSSLENNLLESVRTNSHLFGINRKVVNKTTLGEWQIDGTITWCSAMVLRTEEGAGHIYKNANRYNPERFETESKDKYNLNTWGAGVHFCPGKMFAVKEMMIVAKTFKDTFRVQWPDSIGNRNYNTPASFAIIPMEVTLTLK